jgi:hypothetical protein
MSTPEQRRRLRTWWRMQKRHEATWPTTCLGRLGVPPTYHRAFTLDLYNLTCGARTRASTPCNNPAARAPDGAPRNGRCRLHGGVSTGPRTAQGKARSARNGSCPKRSGRAC